MAESIDLHGAEVLYLPDQAAPITIGPSSIVGLVGAAPHAQAAASAGLAIGRGNAALTFSAAAQVVAVASRLIVGQNNAALAFTAAAAGAAGDTVSIALADPGGANQALSIAVAGRAITVSLATDGGGAVTTTGALLVAYWTAGTGAAARALAGIANAAGSTGASVLAAVARTALAGGSEARAAGGAAGNAISLEIVRPNAAASALTVTVDGTAIAVSLATDAAGEPTTTGVGLIAAWAAQAAAAARALATIAPAAGSTGADAVSPIARTRLAGGLDESFPLNVPTAVSTAAAAARLGMAGSLPAALADVWRTAGRVGATVVAVRTADDTAASVIGARGAPKTGIYALLDAAQETGLQPRLIAAPALETTAAALALEAVADELRAIPVVALAGATYSEAVAAKAPLAHAYAVWPHFRIFDSATGQVVDRSSAALAIGHIVRVDTEASFAASPSNRRMQDVAGTAVAIDWQLGSRSATANLLSRAFIATAIRRRGGLYLWGNRLADGELITHRRVRHLIGDALLGFVIDYIDRQVDVPFVDHVLDRMNSFLRSQTLRRTVTGGRAWFDRAHNTPDTLAADRITFSFDLGLYAVAEQITFRQSVSGIYNAGIVEQLTGAG